MPTAHEPIRDPGAFAFAPATPLILAAIWAAERGLQLRYVATWGRVAPFYTTEGRYGAHRSER